uniref:Uncharacterized protein n=1 Tax=Chaetoceros debilis TaxID=122233 RepID=A0A7S3V560_9STRA|mmetsp:Transcript_19738/g.29895  ORF Transcript_19738/g.29895 Transcript_19738/m.29895 type:complete len:176 (+) Transcript_19738:2-529(+)
MRSDKNKDDIANTVASPKNSKETIVTTTASTEFQIEANMNVDNRNCSSRSPTDGKLRELEFQLFRKNADLQEQQKSHSKAMREQKERFEDQIQALQMRLYISETKLKNHEDALRQHMKAVGATLTANVPTSTGTGIEHVKQTIPVRVSESESSRSYSRTSSPASPRRKRNILYEA